MNEVRICATCEYSYQGAGSPNLPCVSCVDYEKWTETSLRTSPFEVLEKLSKHFESRDKQEFDYLKRYLKDDIVSLCKKFNSEYKMDKKKISEVLGDLYLNGYEPKEE